MMRFGSRCGFLSHAVLLVLGVVLGLFAAAHFFHGNVRVAQGSGTSDSAAPPPSQTEPAQGKTTPPARESPQDTIERKLREWNLDPEQIRRELDRAGEVIREKSQQASDYVRDEWPDVKIIAVIKGRYILDKELDAWHITVGCSDGHVTLSGSVESVDLISRAIVIALDTSGVVDVASRLRVRGEIQQAFPAAPGQSGV